MGVSLKISKFIESGEYFQVIILHTGIYLANNLQLSCFEATIERAWKNGFKDSHFVSYHYT